MNNLPNNPRLEIIKYILFATVTFLFFYIIDLVAGGYLEKHILSGASRDWRDSEHNFKNTSCYSSSDTLGFEPVWGNCGNYDIYKELSEQNSLADFQKKYKILILGDSNTKQGEFDVKIEQGLIKRGGRNVSVIKIGIPSYNTSQEVELLKTNLVGLKPNLVVLQFTPNDFTITPVVVKAGNEMWYLSAQGEKRFLTNEFLYKYSKLYS